MNKLQVFFTFFAITQNVISKSCSSATECCSQVSCGIIGSPTENWCSNIDGICCCDSGIASCSCCCSIDSAKLGGFCAGALVLLTLIISIMCWNCSCCYVYKKRSIQSKRTQTQK
eukprot:c2027_g1_i1.p1 GENE.c2027_g1_i1~~c2027_g1_i1.p1  ORF type:complete len:115 (+),score=19.60 c2027_g1_i1:167-511(+)